MNDAKYYYIEIKRFTDDEVVKRLDASDKSQRSRQKIEDGMNINLNHSQYYTFSFPSVNQLPTI